MRILLGTLLQLLILTGCATRFQPAESYTDARAKEPVHHSAQTTVVFLVDGLSFQTLNPELLKGRLPQIRKHFFAAKNSRIYQAHTLFPSLTFPAISSLLHEAPVHQTGSLGNTVFYKGSVASFEKVSDRSKFSEMMTGNTIFSRLKAKGQKSVSLDYGLGVDASVAADTLDLKIGLAATLEEYIYLDDKKLDSLRILLSETPADQWPEFVFVHLVGVDFTSHQFGAQSPEAFRYLETLDGSLKEVFELLRKGESQAHPVVTMLTADHGFSAPVTKSVDLEKRLRQIHPQLISFNEGRMASVYARKTPSATELDQWSRELLKTKGVEIVATKSANQVTVRSKQDLKSFVFVPGTCQHSSMAVSLSGAPAVCPEALGATEDFFGPFFIQNLAYFFQADHAPDMAAIPSPHTVFGKADGGFHGGPTPEEVFIPLLLRNAELGSANSTPAIWDLLSFL